MSQYSDGSIIIDTELDTEGFAKGSAKLDKACESLIKQVQKIGDTLKRGIRTPAQLSKFSADMEKAKKTVSELEEKLQELGSKTISTPEYESLAKGLENASAKADELGQKIEATVNAQMQEFRDLGKNMTMEQAVIALEKTNGEFRRLEQESQTVSNRVDEITRKMREMADAGKAVKLGSDTQQYADLQSKLQSAKGQMDGISNSGTSLLGTIGAIAGKAAPIIGVTTAIWKIVKKISAEMEKILKTILNKIKSALSSIGNLTTKAFKGIANGFTNIYKKLSGNKGVFERISESLSSAQKSATGLFTRITSMIKTRLIRKAISDLIDGMKEALNSLAKYSSEFNASMSSMSNAASELKANFAVAFSGIINAVAPVLTELINLVSKAFSYISALIALLSGKTTVTVAKKQMKSYAGSLGDVADAANDANKALAAFDEINNISSSNGSSGSSGSGDLFEDVSIDNILPESIREWFQAIKDAIQSEDWAGLGSIIADGLNTAILRVDNWIINTLRPKGVLWASRIAEVLNGLVDGFDWEALGKTIADGINAAFDILGTFIRKFNWSKLANGLSKGLNKLVSKIEPDTIGKAIGSIFNAAIDFATSVEINWSNIGAQIGQAISNIVNETRGKWSSAGAAIGSQIRGMFLAIRTVIENIPWQQIGHDIADFLIGIDLTQTLSEFGVMIGEALAGILNSVGSMIVSFSESGGFKSLGEGIVKAIKNVISGLNENGGYSFADVLISLVNGLIETLSTIVNSSDWALVLKSIFDSLKKVLLNIRWSEAAQTLVTFINGLIQSLAEFVSSGEWKRVLDEIYAAIVYLIQNIDWGTAVDAFVTFVNDIVAMIVKFINSDSFRDVVDAICNAISELDWAGIAEIWAGLAVAKFKIKAATAFGKIGGFFKNLFSGFGEDSADGFSIGLGSSGIAAGIKTTMKDAEKAGNQVLDIHSPSGVFKEMAEKCVEGFEVGMKNNWKSITEYLKTALSDTNTQIGKGFDTVKDTAKTKWTDIKTTVTTLYDSLRKTLLDTDFKTVGANIVSGLENGIRTSWDRFKSWFNGLVSGLVSGVKSLLGIASPSKVFEAIGLNTGEGLQLGLEESEAGIFKAIGDIANAMEGELSGVKIDVDSSGMYGVLSVLDKIADKLGSISEALGGMYMPAMARGTVVPYKARVSSSDRSAEAGSSSSSSSGQAGDLVAALKQVLAEGLVLHITQYMDGKVVYDTVVEHSKQSIRRTGRFELLGE